MTPCARPLTVLGSTGSIGCHTLAVAEALGIPIVAITAHDSVALLAEQARRYRPQTVVVTNPARADQLRALLADESRIAIAVGTEALNAVAADPAAGAVMTAIVGAAGLEPTLAAVRAGKRVCIANKEPLVMAGELITAEARRSGASLLPVDSEHSAIFQCLDGHRIDEAAQLILTGSGGPFRTRYDLDRVTTAEALDHPNWSMGPKITIDSATLMNKALELIEAHWLFAMPTTQIEILIHPQSIVHSMVAFRDGSVMAQLGLPDMRTPIQYALTWPEHVAGPVAAPDFAALATLDFQAPDRARFPSIDFAYAAATAGGVLPTIMNAANEVAVDQFLNGRIGFTDIFRLVEHAMARAPRCDHPDLATILDADRTVRKRYAEAS